MIDTTGLECNVYDGLKVWEPKANDTNNRDQIMRISGSTHFLQNMIIPQHAKLSLEIGTGVGYIAMQLAKHSDMVIATDINVEALKLAKFNAEQNGIHNIQFICCDMFTSFKEHKFDLIVSNPPFVISPDNKQTFRDNDFLGDGFMQWFIQESLLYLADNGTVKVIGEWINEFDEEWFCDNSCINLVIPFSEADIPTYINRWLNSKCPDRVREWKDYYEQHNVKTIQYGLITMEMSNSTTVGVVNLFE